MDVSGPGDGRATVTASDSLLILRLEREALSKLEGWDRCGFPLATVRLDSLPEGGADRFGAAAWIEDPGPAVNLFHARFQGQRRLTHDQLESIYRSDIGAKAMKVDMARRRFRGCAPYAPLLDRALAGMESMRAIEEISLTGWDVMTADSSSGAGTYAIPVLTMKETGPSRFQGVLGMGESSRGEVVWMGEAQLDIPMLFHPGWFMGSSLRRTQDLFEIEIRTGSERIFGWPLEVQGGFESLQREASYLDQSLALALDWRGRGAVGVSGGWRHRMLRFADAAVAGQKGGGGSIVQNVLSAGVRVESANHRTDSRYGVARQGWRGDAVVRIAPDRHGWTRREAGWIGAMPMGARYGGSLKLDAMEVDARGAGLFEADLIRLGGHRSFRGYREDQYRVTRAAMATAELGAFLGSGLRASLFTGAGLAWLPAASVDGAPVGDGGSGIRPGPAYATYDPNRTERITLLSYGVTVSVPSRGGRIDLAVAFSQGDSFGQGKFHITFHP